MSNIELKVTPGQIVGHDDPRLEEFWRNPVKWKLKLVSYDYVDADRNLQTFTVTKATALPVKDKFKLGYMTKLNNQRWGATITLDLQTRELRVHVDLQSPIMLVNVILEKQ